MDDTHYQEDDTKNPFQNGDSTKSEEAIADILEKKNALCEEVKNLNREQEI
jgi:hypothetical protein